MPYIFTTDSLKWYLLKYPKPRLARNTPMSNSPFLNIPPEKWLLSNELAFAVFDGFPVSVGHVLVLTKRLVPTWFDASPDEQQALMSLVNDVKQHLDSTLQPKPAGYNVGFNTGEAAGQTATHLSIQFIPRFRSAETPTAPSAGGIRQVVPKAMLASPKRTRRA